MKLTNNNNLYKNTNLSCTKEVISTFIRAEQLAIYLDSKFIEPYHILLSLFLEDNLSKLLLNISNLNVLTPYLKNILNNYKLYKNNVTEYKLFNINSLHLILSLYKLNRPFHTLDLLTKIIESNKEMLKEEFGISELDLTNLIETIETQLGINKKTIEYSPFYTNLINNIDLSYTIIGREAESSKLLEIISRKIQRNPILVGNYGVGRKSLINYSLASVKIKELYKNFNTNKILLLDTSYLSTISTYNKEDIEKKLDSLLTYIKNNKDIILVIPSINELFISSGTGDQSYSSTLLNILKPLLENNCIQIIGTSSLLDYEKTISKFAPNLFDKLVVNELPEVYIKEILKIKKIELEQYHKVYINSNCIDEIYRLGKDCLKDNSFPGKAITLLDMACAKVKVHENILNNKLPQVKLETIFKIVSDTIGVPETFIAQNSNSTTTSLIVNLEAELNKKVFGQEYAISKISSAIRRAYSGLKHPNRPIGSWLLCGPSGTGKTELAKTIAKVIFGSEKEMVRFDMSEFMEKHSTSRLIGSPPGYVGYGEGGQLTEAVYKNPYTVLLFDEIEKAHVDVNNLMLQVLDEGRLTDSTGKSIDFSNTIILFTSNLGCPTNSNEFKDLENKTNKEKYFVLSNKIITAINKYFRPEFINRLDNIIVFKPLDLNNLYLIVEKFLNQIRLKLKNNNSTLTLDISPDIKKIIAKLGYQPIYGARPLKRLMDNLIEKPISELLMNYNLNEPHLFYVLLNKKTNCLSYALKKLIN